MIFSFIVPLTGCWDANEPDRMSYAQGLGVDYKDGKYIVYIQLMNLSLLAKTESGAGTGKQIKAEIGHSTGKSVEEAIYNLYQTTQRRIHWGHLTYIFVTKTAIAQNGLKDVTDIIDRYFETHYRMWIYCTNDSLSKVMDSEPPINMSTYLSRLSDPDAAFGQYSFIQAQDMREILISHYEPPHDMIVPVVGSDKTTWKGDKETRNIGVIKGLSIVNNNSLLGTILDKDANGYRWIQKKFDRTGISIDANDNETIGITVGDRRVNIKPIVINGRVQFDIELKLRASISKFETNLSASQISSKAKSLIKQEIQATYLKGLESGADVYRLSHVLYKNNLPAWKKIESNGKIPLNKDSIRKIKIDLLISHGGKQRKMPTLDNN